MCNPLPQGKERSFYFQEIPPPRLPPSLPPASFQGALEGDIPASIPIQVSFPLGDKTQADFLALSLLS